jgi:hypothetical protein
MLGLVRGQVVAHDPPWGVRVAFRTTGQQASFRVQMGRDWAAGPSARQKPLPQIGTWGLVSFPEDDLRNGVWICSYYPSQIDALTTTQASGFAATDPHIDYNAHFSGDWSLLNGSGFYSKQWVDGSYLTIASGVGLPPVYRHIVASGNVQQTVVYPFSDGTSGSRRPTPQSPMYYDYHHATGTRIYVDTSGSVMVSGASGIPSSGSGSSGVPGAMFTTTFGQTIVTIDVSGNTTVSGSSGASGASGHAPAMFQALFGKTTVSINPSGTVTVSGASGAVFQAIFGGVFLTMDVSGNVTLGSDAVINTPLLNVNGGVQSTDKIAVNGTINCGGIFFSASYGCQWGNDTFIAAPINGEITCEAGGSGGVVLPVGGVAWTSSSDYRQKEIKGDFSNSGEIIDAIPIHLGKYKHLDRLGPLFLAHEVQAGGAGFAVYGDKDEMRKNADTGDIEPHYQRMDSNPLVATLWAEIRNMRKRLADLETSIEDTKKS